MVWIVVAAMVASGLVGLFLAPALIKRPDVRMHCTAFAAGVLLTVILTHVVPEAMGTDHRYGGAVMLAGFMAMMFLQQKVLKADPCCGHEHAKHAGLPSYLAMVACSVNDGLILTSLTEESGVTSPLLYAMCAHKLTATFSLVMLLRETSAGLKPSTRLIYMLIFVMITPAVVLLADSLSFLTAYMHYVVGLGAGALLYVICGGMVPRVEHLAREGKNWILLTFLIGACITIVTELVAPHHHHHHH